MTTMQWNSPTKLALTALLLAGLLGGCKSSTPAPAPATTSGTASPAPTPGAPMPPPSTPGTQSAAPVPGSPGVQGEPAAQAAPAPAERSLRAGTSIPVRITERLSASHNEVGDSFRGVVAEDVREHGDVVLRRGTPVEGRVVASKGRGRFKGAGALGIELTTIAGAPVTSSEYEVAAKGKGKRTAAFAGGGAGLGAIIGGIAGGGKGALIGGLAGAGGGTAADAFTGNRDVVIPSESIVRFRLEHAVMLR